MELSVRDWIVIVGVLLFLALLLDGFRRVRAERRNAIRMSLKAKGRPRETAPDEHERPDVLLQNPELPNGGARVIAKRGPLRLDADVPVLMDAETDEDVADDDDSPSTLSMRDEPAQVPEPEARSVREPDPEPVAARAEPVRARTTEAERAAPLPNEVVVVNVMSRNGEFRGRDLLQILMACDLRYGKMNIFHRFEQASGRGPIQFSVANAVEPGTFNIDQVDELTTPGVCFFMTMPGPAEPLKAFEHMVETAQCVVKHLNGELRDEARSVMTMQTLEHCRARIADFERRQLAHHA